MVESMDVKPVFAVALVACCMACSFVLKLYTNQTNVMLFGQSNRQDMVSNEKKALTDYFTTIKPEEAPLRLKKQGEDLTTGAILVRLYAD